MLAWPGCGGRPGPEHRRARLRKVEELRRESNGAAGEGVYACPMSMRIAEPTFATRNRLMNVVANGKRNSSANSSAASAVRLRNIVMVTPSLSESASLRIRQGTGCPPGCPVNVRGHTRPLTGHAAGAQ